MKQKKLSDYTPKYPRKAAKGALLAATALIALGAAAGCRFVQPQTGGVLPGEEPPMTPGAPLIEPTPDPEDIQTDGYVSYLEPEDVSTERPMMFGMMPVVDPMNP